MQLLPSIFANILGGSEHQRFKPKQEDPEDVIVNSSGPPHTRQANTPTVVVGKRALRPRKNKESTMSSATEKTPILIRQGSSLDAQDGGAADSTEAFRNLNRSSLSSSLAASYRSLVDAAFSLPGANASVRDFGGTATMASEITNMSKNLIGGGVLSLSGGIAICANSPAAVVPATLWIFVLAAVFGYFCWLIGKICKYTYQVTYRELWQDTVGQTGAMTVPFVNAFKAGLGNLAYASILSQTAVSLCESIGFEVSRITCLFFITITMLLPLCLLKSLQVLAPLSVLGTCGILVTTAAMTVRYLDGSYQPGGQFYNDLDPMYTPHFGDVNGAWGIGILPFACMAFEAYVMHYNSARFYAELKDANLTRFGGVVGGAFGFSAVVYAVIASIGYLTFGANSSSYILNNYSSKDPLATACRLLVAFSTLTTYPIVFTGFRDGVLNVLDIPPSRQTSSNLNVFSIVLLTALTVTAVFVTDLGLINAVGGGTLATVMVFVFPTIMYRKLVKKQGLVGEDFEVTVATVMMVIGIFLGVIGVYLSIVGVK
mmetsp:Transcript_13041/g.17072  ORF Transcript_13041/g.17072 Transcript_13041/m.17072 type:complete len:543 (+) Transcript_13041:49-1677(+)